MTFTNTTRAITDRPCIPHNKPCNFSLPLLLFPRRSFKRYTLPPYGKHVKSCKPKDLVSPTTIIGNFSCFVTLQGKAPWPLWHCLQGHYIITILNMMVVFLSIQFLIVDKDDGAEEESSPNEMSSTRKASSSS